MNEWNEMSLKESSLFLHCESHFHFTSTLCISNEKFNFAELFRVWRMLREDSSSSVHALIFSAQFSFIQAIVLFSQKTERLEEFQLHLETRLFCNFSNCALLDGKKGILRRRNCSRDNFVRFFRAELVKWNFMCVNNLTRWRELSPEAWGKDGHRDYVMK